MKLFRVSIDYTGNGWSKYIRANTKDEALKIANKKEFLKADIFEVEEISPAQEEEIKKSLCYEMATKGLYN